VEKKKELNPELKKEPEPELPNYEGGARAGQPKKNVGAGARASKRGGSTTLMPVTNDVGLFCVQENLLVSR